MSRDDKLIQKLKDDKSTVTFDDAASLLGSLGFVLKKAKQAARASCL